MAPVRVGLLGCGVVGTEVVRQLQLHAGAYCRSMASNYNLIGRPPVVAVRDGAARLLLRRETDDDLARLEVG